LDGDCEDVKILNVKNWGGGMALNREVENDLVEKANTNPQRAVNLTEEKEAKFKNPNA
jgi:hypothetical protein